jgi:hypothetical protein
VLRPIRMTITARKEAYAVGVPPQTAHGVAHPILAVAYRCRCAG